MAIMVNQNTVACTPEGSFDYCVDIRNEPEWKPRAMSVGRLTDGRVGVGNRFLAGKVADRSDR